ncbi:MAG: hypothetical protein ACP5JE_05965, partial [Thermoplasmata archaeon]
GTTSLAGSVLQYSVMWPMLMELGKKTHEGTYLGDFFRLFELKGADFGLNAAGKYLEAAKNISGFGKYKNALNIIRNSEGGQNIAKLFRAAGNLDYSEFSEAVEKLNLLGTGAGWRLGRRASEILKIGEGSRLGMLAKTGISLASAIKLPLLAFGLMNITQLPFNWGVEGISEQMQAAETVETMEKLRWRFSRPMISFSEIQHIGHELAKSSSEAYLDYYFTGNRYLKMGDFQRIGAQMYAVAATYNPAATPQDLKAEAERLRSVVVDLTRTFRMTATEAANVVTQFKSLGLAASDIKKITQNQLALASAETGLTPQQLLTISSSVMQTTSAIGYTGRFAASLTPQVATNIGRLQTAGVLTPQQIALLGGTPNMIAQTAANIATWTATPVGNAALFGYFMSKGAAGNPLMAAAGYANIPNMLNFLVNRQQIISSMSADNVNDVLYKTLSAIPGLPSNPLERFNMKAFFLMQTTGVSAEQAKLMVLNALQSRTDRWTTYTDVLTGKVYAGREAEELQARRQQELNTYFRGPWKYIAGFSNLILGREENPITPKDVYGLYQRTLLRPVMLYEHVKENVKETYGMTIGSFIGHIEDVVTGRFLPGVYNPQTGYERRNVIEDIYRETGGNVQATRIALNNALSIARNGNIPSLPVVNEVKRRTEEEINKNFAKQYGVNFSEAKTKV